MILRNKNILLISPEPWDHIFVSKHHYAVHLGRRENKIFFLNPPGIVNSLSETEYPNVVSVQYTRFPKGLRFYPRFLRKYFTRQKFHELEQSCNVQFDIIWSFDNSVFFDFSALAVDVLKICHIVDLNQDFQTRYAALTANVCFCTTELIKARLLKFNLRCYKINHGFNNTFQEGKAISLPGGSAVKVIYAGNLAMPYIDWNLLKVVVQDNPGVDFIFIGPDKNVEHADMNSKELVRDAKNTYFPGTVRADDLLHYYRSADILILAYQEKYHADQANPHKMMEYLGSGKMIVATFTAEYAELNERHLLSMSRGNAEFPTNLKQVLDDLDYWNAGDKQLLRKKSAMENTYDKQLERIERLL